MPQPKGKVMFMQGPDLLDVQAQRLDQDIGEHGDAVVFAFAIPDDDLVVAKVQVLDPQAHDFHEPQAAAVHESGP